MFEKIRDRLLLAYMAVLTVILAAFALSVRLTFTRSLNQQFAERLMTLAKAAALELELNEEGEVEVDDETVINSNQAIQWFDTEGNLLEEQGEYALKLPFNPEQSIVTQITPHRAKSLTIPVNDYDTGVFIGYTRVSESTKDLDNTLRSLDLGLGGGVVMALALSGVGGIWLTRQAMRPIEESFQRLKQFTADASHELRSPLMAIQSNAAVALKYPKGMRSTDGEKFEMIASATKQMTRLTEELLLLARTDEVTNLGDAVNLTLILSELVQLYESLAREKLIQLKVELTDNLYLLGDEVLLRQLFTNLIQNAIYYTPIGGVVAILSSRERGDLIVKVQDTGVGIAPEHLSKVFERFWRAEQSRSYRAGKSGLGLAIAQAISQKHGGKITVESQLGVGSCFTVRLRAFNKIKTHQNPS